MSKLRKKPSAARESTATFATRRARYRTAFPSAFRMVSCSTARAAAKVGKKHSRWPTAKSACRHEYRLSRLAAQGFRATTLFALGNLQRARFFLGTGETVCASSQAVLVLVNQRGANGGGTVRAQNIGKHSTRRSSGVLAHAPRAAMPHHIRPMLAAQPFNHPDWIFEIKWDGYRAIAEV